MMRITCPQCGYFRELPDKKVPVTSTMATCPKCRHRFKFRADDDSDSRTVSRNPEPVRPQGDTSSWRRPGPAAQAESADPPVTHWEAPHRHDDMPREAATPPRRSMAPEPENDAPEIPPENRTHTPPRGHQWSQAAREIAAERQTAQRHEVAPDAHDAFSPAPDADVADDAGHHDAMARPDVAAAETVDTAPDAPRADARPAAREDTAAAPAETPCAPETPEAPEAPEKAGTHDDRRPRDGVRDIWARLQAMDNGPSRKRAAKPETPPAPGTDKGVDDNADEAATANTKPDREAVTDPIPWERLDAYGFLPGLFLTLKKILVSPVEFFSAMPEGRPKGKALVFNVLISEFLLLIDFMWSLVGLRARIGDPGQTDALGAAAASSGMGFLIALLLVPLAIACGIYLDAWVTHLLLRLFRSATKSFNETFRVLCYSAAPTVLSAIPVAGQILSPVILVWYMALQAIGLKKVHQGAYTQTLAVIFIKWSIYLFLLLAMLQNFTPGR